MGPPLSIQIAIVKLAICLNAVKAGYCFDILKNVVHRPSQANTKVPGQPLTWLTFVFEPELCTLRASTRPAPMQTSNIGGSRLPLRR